MKLHAWLSSSLARWFPLAPAPRVKPRSLRVDAARGQRASFQVVVLAEHDNVVDIGVSVSSASSPGSGVTATLRRVGCVPVPHHNTVTPAHRLDGLHHIPGFVPDVLFPVAGEGTSRLAPGELNAFWITLDVAPDARAGVRDVEVTITHEKKAIARLTASLHIAKLVLEPRRDFRSLHWFYADALCDWYKVEPWSDAFWPVAQNYIRNYAQHGQDTLLVPMFTPPTDGVKRPTQLLKVRKLRGGKYAFDWSAVTRWIATAKRSGITHLEWNHLFSQWGVKHAIRIYENQGIGGDEQRLLWPADTGATSDTYKKFLSQFLPEFYNYLTREKLLANSFFHLSDEPHGDEALANYRAARGVLAQLAPWMKVFDALSDIRFGRDKLTDMPVPVVSSTKQFVDEGIDCWTYYCCWPRGEYLNRLHDTPLATIRMNGWLFYRFPVRGFLHWGYNYWYKSQSRQLIDPFQTTDGLAWPGWAYGDPFVVYPGAASQGESGAPLDSLRWEVFAESLDDYRLLQTRGIDRASKLLAPLRDFNDFPREEAWINKTRRALLAE